MARTELGVVEGRRGAQLETRAVLQGEDVRRRSRCRRPPVPGTARVKAWTGSPTPATSDGGPGRGEQGIHPTVPERRDQPEVAEAGVDPVLDDDVAHAAAAHVSRLDTDAVAEARLGDRCLDLRPGHADPEGAERPVLADHPGVGDRSAEPGVSSVRRSAWGRASRVADGGGRRGWAGGGRRGGGLRGDDGAPVVRSPGEGEPHPRDDDDRRGGRGRPPEHPAAPDPVARGADGGGLRECRLVGLGLHRGQLGPQRVVVFSGPGQLIGGHARPPPGWR